MECFLWICLFSTFMALYVHRNYGLLRMGEDWDGDRPTFIQLLSSDCSLSQTCEEKTQKHKRFKIMLFITTKHNMHILGVIPFIKLQNDT